MSTNVLPREQSLLTSLWQRLLATDAGDRVLLWQRVIVAAVLLPHGLQKLLGWFGGGGWSATMGFFTGSMGIPAPVAALVIVGESLGALALAAGFLTRLWALVLTATMVGAAATVHLSHGFFMNWFGNQAGEGFEYHILALALLVPLVIKGGGRHAVDGRLGGWSMGQSLTDEALWLRVRSGDRLAHGAVYRRHGGRLLGLAHQLLGQPREAEDLVHDVFLEAWRQADAYDQARGQLRTWLMLRLRSRALDRLKSHAWSRVDGVEPTVLARIAGERSDFADGPRVHRALAALPAEQREVIWLGYFEGLSSSQIAARTGAPLGTVKSRVATAMIRLRSALGELARAA